MFLFQTIVLGFIPARLCLVLHLAFPFFYRQ
jgi:hypothetical protein